MKNLTLSLGRLALVLAGTLSLGACSRAEYATLPRSASSIGSTPVASQALPYVPVAAEESAVVTATPPATPSPAVAQAAPAQAQAAAALAPATAATPVAVAPAAVAKPAAAPKLNLVQRLALHKITKKLDKLASQAPQLKQRDAAAGTSRVGGNLRSAIIFGVVGLILTLLGGIAGIFYVLGVIFILIGLVFLLLWVLDEA